jgi:hypothetical protein
MIAVGTVLSYTTHIKTRTGAPQRLERVFFWSGWTWVDVDLSEAISHL